MLPSGTPHAKAFLTAFSIVGQCHFDRSHKPIIQLLVGEDDYRRLDPATLADHIAEFSLKARADQFPRVGGVSPLSELTLSQRRSG